MKNVQNSDPVNIGREINKVFSTYPRNGSERGASWLHRKPLEDEFNQALVAGLHIVVDGPTGAGKSSLAITTLEKQKRSYKLIQVTEFMDWLSFCRMFIEPQKNPTISTKIAGSVGSEKLILPKLNVATEIGTTSKASDDFDLLQKVVATWQEHQMCEFLTANELTLMIDDFENANDDLVSRIVGICRLLTESYRNETTSVVIVGTNNTSARLFSKAPSLDGRMTHICVGTLVGQGVSWQFLSLGFKKLRLFYPGSDKFSTKQDLIQSIDAVQKATGGLPKSLNDLGKKICSKVLVQDGRERIAYSDIKEACNSHFTKSISECKRLFPGIARCVKDDPASKDILNFLFDNGVGNIVSEGEILYAVSPMHSPEIVLDSLDTLIKHGFLARTGRNEEFIFPTDPKFAHVLGYVVANESEFKKDAVLGEFGKQYRLPM
ncbi:MAG: AAA family ATPase [Armatimonadetes bacterium]|nr:AAA family ATPase [Armatimonadota bacterium]